MNIPTTEDFFKEHSNCMSLSEDQYDYLVDESSFKESMIKFAKLHVKAALKEVFETVEADFEPMGWLAEQHSNTPFIEGEDYEIGISRTSILNAYSLTNIK